MLAQRYKKKMLKCNKNNYKSTKKSNMAARVHNVFSLAEILKIFLSETTKSIEL